MKRRSQTSTLPATKTTKHEPKIECRSTHKSKSGKHIGQKMQKKSKKNSNPSAPQQYIMINGNFYGAHTQTERQQVSHFVTRFKRQAVYEKSIPVYKNERRSQMEEENSVINRQVKVEQLVKNLPIEQKLSLMKQLQKQLSNNPEYTVQCSPKSPQNHQPYAQPPHPDVQKPRQKQSQPQQQSTQKYKMLNIKLCSIEKQLAQKRQMQIEKINKLFYEGQLTASERKYKIHGIDKVKDKKIKIINCTRSLFYTLLHNKFEPDYFRTENIDDAMKELDSLSEFQAGNSEKALDEHVIKMEGESSIQSEIEFERISLEIKSAQKNSKQEQRTDNSDKKSTNQQSLLISPDKSAEKCEWQREKQNKDRLLIQKDTTFECHEQNISIARKLHIPLLLTKQKMEELEWQRKAKAAQKMRSEIDRKIAFQMSQLQIQMEDGKTHFTTLSDINNFIVALYEHIIKKDLEHVVSRLNLPYGKATRDKLYALQQNGGEIDDFQFYSVLDQAHLNEFNMEVTLTVRRFSDWEKIHNKAVFDSFNTHLNAYRPYFELDGDVYPWFVSEKGLTFYEISEDNIEQVFEKTKIKVLQQCSALCGLIPFGIQASESPDLLRQKNNENAQKQEKQSLLQSFPKWGLKLYDYETMVRFLITQQILIKQIRDFARDLQKI